MDEIEVLCIGAAIVDIPLQPVSKNIFDVDSYPLERIAMTTGGDAINEATIISRLGHRTALMSRVGDDAAGYFILDHCRKENIDIQSLKQDADIDTSINVGLVTDDGERTFVTNRNGSLWKLNINDVDFDRFSQVRLLSLASIFNSPLLDGKALTAIFTQARKSGIVLNFLATTLMSRRSSDPFSSLLPSLPRFFKYSEKPIFPSAKVIASTGFIVRRLAKNGTIFLILSSWNGFRSGSLANALIMEQSSVIESAFSVFKADCFKNKAGSKCFIASVSSSFWLAYKYARIWRTIRLL